MRFRFACEKVVEAASTGEDGWTGFAVEILLVEDSDSDTDTDLEIALRALRQG